MIYKFKGIAAWALAVLLTFAFLDAGIAKLTAQPMMVAEFTTFRYPVWFMYVTGLIEIVAAVLVLVPRYSGIGAGLIVCVMIGALASHLTHGQAAMIGAPIVLLLLAVALGTLRGWNRSRAVGPTTA